MGGSAATTRFTSKQGCKHNILNQDSGPPCQSRSSAPAPAKCFGSRSHRLTSFLLAISVSRAATSITADCPSGKAPTKRVHLCSSLMILSKGLFVRIDRPCSRRKTSLLKVCGAGWLQAPRAEASRARQRCEAASSNTTTTRISRRPAIAAGKFRHSM